MEQKGGNRGRYEKLHCEHCDKEVSKSTWYIHYDNSFDARSGTWNKEMETPCQRPDFKFESSEDSSELDMEADVDSHLVLMKMTLKPQEM